MNRSLRDKLAALEQSVGRSSMVPPAATRTVAPAQDEAANLHPTLVRQGFHYEATADGGFWKRTLRYDLLTYHGHSRFADILDCDPATVYRAAKLATDASVASDEVYRLRFYDTETSGLGTGAGTFPFLHAMARIDEDEVVLDQYFLASHTEESALLQALCAEQLSDPHGKVVSFNGKSFDWPLLQTRLVMHRIAAPVAAAQVDLLHLCRRLWKGQLGRVTLKQVEERVLGLTRRDDVPGSEAPRRYFAFVDHHDASDLAPVFDHNAMDVCSLVTLMAMLCGVLAHQRAVGSAHEYAALARWHDEWGEADLAASCYRSANVLPDSTWATQWAEAMHHKRQRRYEEAAAVWRSMVTRYPTSVPPLVELAKLAEHRGKDLAAAESLTVEALARTNRLSSVERRAVILGERLADALAQSARESSVIRDLERRLARIRRKQAQRGE